jgi:hypothetical protein
VTLDREAFTMIKERHGPYASWAVWAPPSAGRPKSNIADLSVLEPTADLLRALRPDLVMLGLNLAGRPLEDTEAFRNFHDGRAAGQDYKIRYAFGEQFGAYMTDIVKNHGTRDAVTLMREVRGATDVMREARDRLLAEFADLGCTRPTLITFGRDAHRIAARLLEPTDYAAIVPVTHYAARLGQDGYRDVVVAELAGRRRR